MAKKKTSPGVALKKLDRQELFLTAYAKGLPTVATAAKTARMDRGTHFAWMKTDERYAERFNALRDERVDEFEVEAARRAVQGVSRLVLHNGAPVRLTKKGKPLEITEYSDALLMFILKAERPGKYKDRQAVDVHHSHDINEWAEICRRSRQLTREGDIIDAEVSARSNGPTK